MGWLVGWLLARKVTFLRKKLKRGNSSCYKYTPISKQYQQRRLPFRIRSFLATCFITALIRRTLEKPGPVAEPVQAPAKKKNTTVYRYFSVSGIFLNMHPFEIVLHFSILALASTYTAATPDTRGLPEVGLNKRIRELVGKRAGPEDDYRNFDKRIRELIGKRTLGEDNFPEKRIRELIGKRAMTDSFDPFNKRIRELVGKRDFVYGEDLFNKDKRIRELVGKRNEVQEQNDMVDKRIRELLGKRGLSADENSDVFVMGVQDLLGKKPEDKRIRELVGKRTRNGAINKRVRELVG